MERMSPYAEWCVRCKGEPCESIEEQDGRGEELRRLIHQSPLTRPLWDYLTARKGEPVCFDKIVLREREESVPHYERRQWAGKLLAAGETASRMIRKADGFLLAAGGTGIFWLCPPEKAENLLQKLLVFTDELQ